MKITTTLLMALLLATSQVSLAAPSLNRPLVNGAVANIPVISPHHLAQLNKPDLVVNGFGAADRPRVLDNNSIQVHVYVAINNVGTKAAGRFKISVDSIKRGRAFVIPFKTPTLSSGSNWYPMTRVNLRAGGSRYISGTLTFRASERGKTVFVRVKVDSCSGEEFTCSYCRVNESNENNNTSRLVRIRLP